ncbi:LRR receptor-like serine/threonine-protein kinase ERL2 [Papaver somniferum]|uniref:LRR receptor-like serine/threonine-protein kinase ERL2 n=1 Tax=Papaver somniferum TaxID=3469 RepID=UPI000E704E55|nr:LRR receptor-like serine/threonine-protein kinase ERL2 [Papaver somniferum]
MKKLYPLITILLLYLLISVKAMLDPMDFLALQAIRKSLNDLPGSNFFTSWDFTSDPCNFAGVYCVSDRVIALNLGDPVAGSTGLTGHLDPSIGKLSSLIELSIVPGRIIGTLPNTLNQLKNLRFLAISKNFISGDIHNSISELKNLRTIDLSYNQLTGSIPRTIGTFRSLNNLILCHNHLSGGVPPFFSESLTRLDLKHNELTGSLYRWSFPASLQYLSLSMNRLTGPVDRLLTRLNRLNYLDLSQNYFTGGIPGNLFTFPISNLQLERNMFTGNLLPSNQVMIETVDVSHNKFYGQISPLFSSVQKLYMNHNKFFGQVPGSFVASLMSAHIQILYLQHNYLTGIQINPTAEIPLSSSVCLQYNCMVPPIHTTCPISAGTVRRRPAAQCGNGWKG